MFSAIRHLPLGIETLASLSSATGLTVPSGATMAIFSTAAQAVRFRDDGTDPTSAIGIGINVGDAPFEYSGDLSKIKFIEQAASATLTVAYYKVAG